MTYRRSPALLVTVLLAATACGGGAGPQASAATSSEASVIAHANDPRESDPTAAAAPGTPTPPSNLKIGGKSAPSASAAPPPAFPKTSTPQTEPDPTATAAATGGDTTSSAEPPKKIGARHVLIQWMGAEKAETSIVRTKDQALTVAKEVLRRARAGENLARLAVEYSDEPGAGPRGGSLGRFGHGQMVPAFEDAAFHLKVGQISDIVESPFGYHIIQRTE